MSKLTNNRMDGKNSLKMPTPLLILSKVLLLCKELSSMASTMALCVWINWSKSAPERMDARIPVKYSTAVTDAKKTMAQAIMVPVTLYFCLIQ